MDQYIVKDVSLAAARGMIAFLFILNEDAGLKPGPFVLANPSQLQSLLLTAHNSPPLLQATTRQRTV